MWFKLMFVVPGFSVFSIMDILTVSFFKGKTETI